MSDGKAINVLFVCSMNRWRSPTAENVYAKDDQVNTRSRGTSKKAVRSICAGDLKWANVIFVMETKHRQQVKSRFPGEVKFTELHVLHIPDEYQFMDPELIQEIRDSVDPVLAAWGA